MEIIKEIKDLDDYRKEYHLDLLLAYIENRDTKNASELYRSQCERIFDYTKIQEKILEFMKNKPELADIFEFDKEKKRITKFFLGI